MKWRLRFLWSRAKPAATFCTLLAVPFLPVVPWVLAAGPDPAPLDSVAAPEVVSLTQPIPKGAADPGSVRGPSPPLDPRAIRRISRTWEMKAIDGSGWKLLMTDRFAVRGDILADDLRAVGAFAECFLDSIHERARGDLAGLRLSIRVFAQEEEFAQWASCRGVEAAGGFYDQTGAEVALLFSGGTDVAMFCGHLMRGVALEYLDRALEYRGPRKVAEGVADWFADYQVLKGRVAPRRPRSDVGELLRIADPARLEATWNSWAAGP